MDLSQTFRFAEDTLVYKYKVDFTAFRQICSINGGASFRGRDSSNYPGHCLGRSKEPPPPLYFPRSPRRLLAVPAHGGGANRSPWSPRWVQELLQLWIRCKDGLVEPLGHERLPRWPKKGRPKDGRSSRPSGLGAWQREKWPKLGRRWELHPGFVKGLAA